MIKNVLISLDSFKGSISSKEANIQLQKGIESINPQLNIKCVPIGDGGEGTIESIIEELNGDIKTIKSVNSKNKPIDVSIGLVGDKIFIESSNIIGLDRLTEKPDAYVDSSRGLGIVIEKALEYSPSEIIVTLGGSAISDMGIGMLDYLGSNFYNKEGVKFSPKGTDDLKKIHRLDFIDLEKEIFNTKFTILSDVENTLLGKNGCIFTYGEQKGLDRKDFEDIDKEIARISSMMEEELGKKFSEYKFSGAAGGLGFAFMSIFKARSFSGIEKILEITKIEEKIITSDLIITGEGSMDLQTYHGKAPIGISNLAKKHNKLCFAVTASNNLINENYEEYFDYIFNLQNKPLDLDYSIRNTSELLYLQGKQIARIIELINEN
ncbi:glycerate kinase [uncultured Helcococcus sp.]|uniref:glycerate kinase n=1 Tax=uncultured Helcococcus sp. TaxID=1072508 RepID=UPI00288B9E08|nr:glycerate kinase [uncultured Helcococcus sp.]